ncbi:DNA polymerase IV [Acuticoccus sp. I52.16.1]|uniref:DNA polymerase IV n=1 Tax=Acuticoccus sp. I52.16.1 TaxID=2928472 RepID=UPI001FD3024B|nr:DNA polymerase IV [Acuticoccus sp. I52.16.1]UOM35440.1 DNA polymerase IV [Acuticoccus sp. I52.16.1]
MSAAAALCRDCAAILPIDAPTRCPRCRSPRLVRHAELTALVIAHVDCDAFFAAVEKRDDPSLRDVPVIVGGGRRGVVSTCCYLARIHGVRSAMPMFKALQACPDAVVVRPNFEKYVAAGREVRDRMKALTPLVQPLSIDEAFLDLSGTERLHGAPPAAVMARFAKRVEDEIGITVSVGLAPNKFLAKFASDADKPRGYTVVGQVDAEARLADEPVTRLPGVGPAAARKLEAGGVRLVRDVQRANLTDLMRRFGETGQRLKRLAHGKDDRAVDPSSERKSVSAEETFEADIADRHTLLALLRHLSEKVSTRAKAAEIGGRTITLKLKTPQFRTISRSESLEGPTAMAHRIFAVGKALLLAEPEGQPYRLIGIGISGLVPAGEADGEELFDPARTRLGKAERAMDALRARFGDDAVVTGLSLSRPQRHSRPDVPRTDDHRAAEPGPGAPTAGRRPRGQSE